MTFDNISVQILNQKGLRLSAEIYKPTIRGKLPFVILLHGFTGYKEEINLVDIAKRLAEKGIASLRFTQSGFGDSDGTLASDYRFSNYRDDAEAIFRYIFELSYVDITRIGVYGHSIGGKLAVLFCADHIDIRSLCLVSVPVSFVGTMYGLLQKEWEKTGYFEKISGRDGKIVKVPYTYFTDAESSKHDVLQAAHRIKHAQALVIAGKADREVPWQETKKLYEALQCQKHLLVVDALVHKYKSDLSLMKQIHSSVINFFVKHL